MFRTHAACVLAGIILLTGCAHESPAPSSGRLIAEYVPDKEVNVSNAPYQASYVLRHWPAPPSDPPPQRWIPEEQVVDLFVRGLDKRQPVGFEKTDDGKLLAIAGEEKITLAPGHYCWHIHPSSEYTGLQWFIHETGDRTVEIVSLPFAFVAAAVAMPFVFGVFLFTWPWFLL